MRSLFLAALTLATLGLYSGDAAAQTIYPWCLIEGGRSGAWRCGYVSFQHCLAFRIGVESCNINPRYPHPYPGHPAPPRRKVRR